MFPGVFTRLFLSSHSVFACFFLSAVGWLLKKKFSINPETCEDLLTLAEDELRYAVHYY